MTAITFDTKNLARQVDLAAVSGNLIAMEERLRKEMAGQNIRLMFLEIKNANIFYVF